MWILWLTAVAALAFDQLSKYLVYQVLDLQTQGFIPVLPPLLEFRGGMNTGVNFGLFADSSDGQRWSLIAIAVILCALLCLWARRSFHRPTEFLSAGLVIGGALGNVADRLFFPGVRDFLNMSCCGIENPYIFNVADIFIFVGAVSLVLFGGEHGRHKKGG